MQVSEFFPIWAQLTPAQQQSLQDCAIPKHIAQGTMLHSSKQDCLGLLLVERGQLRVYILSPEGRQITLYRLLDREICLLSASCIMRSISFDIQIEAEKDTTLRIIPANVYQHLLAQSAPLSSFTNEIMASRFSDVMWLLEQVLWQRLDQRLANFLLNESVLEGSQELHLTHEVIGNHIGSPREVVTRMLRYFQSEGLVSLQRGKICLLNPAGLEQIRQAP